VQLANLLAELAPGDLSTVKFECGGAEVVEAAIKLARQYHKLTGSPGKYKIVSRYQSWHGSTLAALSASGLKSRKTVNEPMAPGFLHVFPPTCYRCPFGKSYRDCGITCATIVGDVVEMEDPATVAAILVEPIGHTGGVIDPPEEYLPILREICDRHNILLIFDEIITGIGRTGRMFAAETFGVTPDVLCVAKGLSGGYAPLSAMICRRGIADAFWGPISQNPGFVEGHTFEGNPISCAAGIAVLREIIERDLLANARARGERLRQGLLALAQKHAIIGDVRGKGLFHAIELVRDAATRARFADADALGVKVGRRALEHGLLCRFDPHWIAFGPPLVVTDEHIDTLLAILDRSLGEVLSEVEARGTAGSIP
jgi:adenosylmethionine-8-amino-7-oxononanoate aminotransferase